MPIILLTSHTEFAMDGYEMGVFRFLAKPVNEEKLYKALDDIVSRMSDDKKIMLRIDGEDRMISVSSIMYITASNVYLDVVMKDETLVVRKKLKDIMEELPEELFVQIHRSSIVNVSYVASVSTGDVVMQDGKKLSATKQKIAELKSYLMKSMRSR
jgi:two-component system LytT family response regulator